MAHRRWTNLSSPFCTGSLIQNWAIGGQMGHALAALGLKLAFFLMP